MHQEGTQSIIYLKNVKGNFSTTDSLKAGSINVGTYIRAFTEDYAYVGGWWKIDVGATINTSLGAEINPYLVVQDIIRQGITRTLNEYFNVLGISQNTPSPGVVRTSEIGILSYEKTYSIQGQPVVTGLITDSRFFLRVGPGVMTGKVAGNTVNANPITTTTYNIVGSDANNCADSILLTVNVNPLPTAVISPTAKIGQYVNISPYTVIENNVNY